MKEDVSKKWKRNSSWWKKEPDYVHCRKQNIRRDNVKVFGFPCELNTEGIPMKENVNYIIKNVADVSNSIDAGLSEKNFSVAHRLTSRMNLKSRVAYFSKSCLKNVVENKKKLANLSGLFDIKFYEDNTRPRMNFIKLLRREDRVEPVWTKDSTTFFCVKTSPQTYKIRGLLEGGSFMDYSLNNVKNGFWLEFSVGRSNNKKHAHKKGKGKNMNEFVKTPNPFLLWIKVFFSRSLKIIRQI